MNKKYQFFISSQRHKQECDNVRLYAFRTILELGHIPVGVDNDYSEFRYTTKKYAGKYIDSSQFVIFILSGHYASFNNKSGLGYIEEEYNYALSRNKQIVCFIDKDYQDYKDEKQIHFINSILTKHRNNQTIYYCNINNNINNNINKPSNAVNSLDFCVVFRSAIANLVANASPASYWVRTSSVLDKNSNDDPMARLRLYINNSADERNIDILALMYKDLEELNEFYTLTKKQAKRSFWLAVSMCISGFFLFAMSAYSAILGLGIGTSALASVGAVIVEILAGTALYVYNKSLVQLNRYYDALHNNERYMSLIHISMKTEDKDALLGEIVKSELARTHIEAQQPSTT